MNNNKKIKIGFICVVVVIITATLGITWDWITLSLIDLKLYPFILKYREIISYILIYLTLIGSFLAIFFMYSALKDECKS